MKHNANRILIPIGSAAGLVCGILCSSVTYAQGGEPLWRTTLQCDASLQKFRGIEYCNDAAKPATAYVIVVDTQAPGVRFEYVIASGFNRNSNRSDLLVECQDVNTAGPHNTIGQGCYDPKNHNYYPVMKLLDAVSSSSGAAVVINSDYGAHTAGEPASRMHGPEGMAVIRGVRIDGSKNGDIDNNAVNRPWVAISKDSPLHIAFDQFASGSDTGDKPEWVYTAIGGAPWLIRDGKIATDEQIKKCKNADAHSCSSRFAQTAVAISTDDRWLYWIVTTGKNAEETAKFIYDTLKPKHAIKLDGGGSSQLWYRGLTGSDDTTRVAYPGDGRLLSNFIAIHANSGNGIDRVPLSPGPVLPPLPDQNWFELIWGGIRQRIEFWWETARTTVESWWKSVQSTVESELNRVEAEINRLLEQARRDLEEWIRHEVQRAIEVFLRQLCASAALPGGGVVIWLVIKRRRQ